jgi:hypothetical protein
MRSGEGWLPSSQPGPLQKSKSVFSVEAEAVLHGMKPNAPSAVKARIAADPRMRMAAPVT